MQVCLRCGDEFAGTGILCSTCIAEIAFKEEVKDNRRMLAVEQTKKTLSEFKIRNFINVFQVILSLFLLW